MSGLYERLFRYRERPTRAPLEDYLSEALADLLDRMSPPQVTAMVAELFLPPAAQSHWKAWVSGAANLKVNLTTQLPLEGNAGRADIVLLINDSPALVIENKIASDLGEKQLERYGRWLSARRASSGEGWAGSLVLLTHTCIAPNDFTDPKSGDYGVPFRRVVRWHEMCAWLQSSPRIFPDANWSGLAGELADFLMQKKLGGDVINSTDLAAAQAFLPSAIRFEETFSRVWDQCSEKRRMLFIKSNSGMKPYYDSEDNLVWAWAYLKPSNANNRNLAYFGWGIAFPSAGGVQAESSGNLPSDSFVFCCLGDDDHDVEKIPSGAPSGWVSENGEIIKAVAVHEFSADPGEFTASLGRWVRQGLDEAQRMLPDSFA